MTTMTNGQVRKSLASQIDRLDQILDGLAEGLNEAVAMAVKEAVALAVQEAVHGILAEVLSNADLLAKLRGTIGVNIKDDSTMAAQAAPTVQKSRVGKLAGQVGSWLGLGWGAVRQAGASVVARIEQAITTVKCRWQLVRQFRRPVMAALIVGVVAGLAAYCGGPYIAAFAGWLAGFTTTLTVQAGIWLRRTFGSLSTDFA
jgi:hypothetical protein